MCYCDPRVKTIRCGKFGCIPGNLSSQQLNSRIGLILPISKELFVGIINLIQNQVEEDERISSALAIISDKDNHEPIYNTLMIDPLVKLLNNAMELEKNDYVGTDIDWWLWETSFGSVEESMRTITYKNKKHDIKTSSDLYDWIIESKKGE